MSLDAVPTWVLLVAAGAALLTLKAVLSVALSGGKFRPVPGGSLIGQLELILNQKDFVRILEKYLDSYGLCELRLGNERMVLLDDPKDVETLLRLRGRVFARPALLSELVDYSSPGVFSAEGSQWSLERRLVSAAFSHSNISSYVKNIRKVTATLMDVIAEKGADGKELDVTSLTGSWIVDVISIIGFGYSFDCLGKGSETVTWLRGLFSVAGLRYIIGGFLPYFRIPLIGQWLDGGAYYRMRIYQVMDDILKAAYEKEGPATTVLDKFIEKNKQEDSPINARRLQGNLLTLFSAGSETTALTTTWMLYHLARDAELQEEARKEAAAAHIDDDTSFSAIIAQLPLLRSLFQEVLRVKGPAQLIGFENPKESVTIAGKVCKPKEYTFLWMSHWFGVRKEAEPLVGPEPEVFNPRRWLLDGGKDVKPIPSVLNPFGGGARICPGRDLALVESLICVAEALRRFELSMPTMEEVDSIFAFTVIPSGPVPIVFKPLAT